MVIFRCILCLIFGALMFSVVQVFAQQSSESEVQRRVVYRERSYFEFEDSLIRGDQPSPDGSSLFRKERVPFRSALNLKRSFMPELRESAKDTR
ncbi:MAG: hypothetical protein EA369_06450 [Bradymonadales bacterium]|nr:MAG: hypothetical protein EA369_06450 [Bradymonadales bacterium]